MNYFVYATTQPSLTLLKHCVEYKNCQKYAATVGYLNTNETIHWLTTCFGLTLVPELAVLLDSSSAVPISHYII